MTYFRSRKEKLIIRILNKILGFLEKRLIRGLKLSQKICREARDSLLKGVRPPRKRALDVSPPHTQGGWCWKKRDGTDEARSDILFTGHKYSLVRTKGITNKGLAPGA